MKKVISEKIWLCPEESCAYFTNKRWNLELHLYKTHNYYKADAIETSYKQEYRINPTYLKNPFARTRRMKKRENDILD